jgi:aminopeptidase N/puromycin-sensitive aminopeptidase
VNQPGAPLVGVSLACVDNRTQATVTQQRFFMDPLMLKQGSPERWQVPLCMKAAGAVSVSCAVLSQPREVLTLDGNACAPWVFANAGAQGYYRTAYSPEALRALAPRVQDVLTPTERLSLTGDEWALVRAGRHDVGQYLTLATGFANEQTNGVLSSVTERLDFIHEYLTSAANRSSFERYVRSLLGPLFQQIGFASTTVDSDERRALRSTLIATLGTTGADPDIAVQARAALDRTLSGGAPLEPTLAGAIVAVAAEHGDRALQDALLAAADRATVPDEHYRYLYALARFRDPALIDRGLEYALTPKLRSQDAAGFFSRFLTQEVARPLAWAFLKQHWAVLQPKVTIFGGDTTVASALGSFCDSASRDDITTFFAAHPLPSAARTLGQTVERINNCIDLRAKQAPPLTEWLRNR